MCKRSVIEIDNAACYMTVDLKNLFLQVGVNGYGFAINNNGFVLFHPGLDEKVRIKYISSFLLLVMNKHTSGVQGI